MNRILLYISVTLLVQSLYKEVDAQNLDQIGTERPLKVNGGISVNQIFYSASNMDDRRDPNSLFLSGNLNIDIYGWSVPLSFTYSNQNTSFQQPFNQYSLHPTYKWITAHIGYSSMVFSPYTVNGHLFNGIGVDAAPTETLKFSAFYGRFQKAVEADTSNNTTPVYKRMGYGFKAGYAKNGTGIELILFHAKDDIHSISYIPDTFYDSLSGEEVLPEENLVVGVNVQQNLAKKVMATVEFATSAITRDLRASESDEKNSNILSRAEALYTPRVSSSYYNAYKCGLNYNGGVYVIGVSYERIAPGYRTLGAYYFNNDLENITANATAGLFNGKVNLSLNAGTQRDNLNDEKVSTFRRMVGALTISYRVSDRLNVNTTYSNFTSFTNIRSQFVDINQLTPYDNLDTLNFTQISRNANVNINYALSTQKEKRQNINLNVSWQDASSEQNGVDQNAGTAFININTAYSLNLEPKNLIITAGFNNSHSEAPQMKSTTLGPILSLTRSYLDKKLRSIVTTSYNRSYTNGTLVSNITSVRATGTYSVKKKHNLNLTITVVNREGGPEEEGFTEFTGTLGYNYNF